MRKPDDYPTIREALRVECPTHKMRDCSPLLNGCTWPSTLNEQYERVVQAVDDMFDLRHGETGL